MRRLQRALECCGPWRCIPVHNRQQPPEATTTQTHLDALCSCGLQLVICNLHVVHTHVFHPYTVDGNRGRSAQAHIHMTSGRVLRDHSPARLSSVTFAVASTPPSAAFARETQTPAPRMPPLRPLLHSSAKQHAPKPRSGGAKPDPTAKVRL